MIGHWRFRRVLPLYASGRLDGAERSRIEDHVQACATCRDEVESIRRLHTLLNALPPVLFSDEDVADARARAFAGLHAFRSRPGVRGQAFEYFSRPAVRGVSIATGALALVLIGFWGGRLLSPTPIGGGEIPLFGSEVQVTQLRSYVDDNLQPVVEVGFERTSREVVCGTPLDPAIQRVLAQALINGLNPGIRLRAAGAIGGPMVSSPDPEVKAAFLLALTSDANDGVRKAALEALLHSPADVKVRDALLFVVLHDPNPGLRMAAINGLDSLRARGVLPDRSTRDALEESARSDKNTVVRVKAQSYLKEN